MWPAIATLALAVLGSGAPAAAQSVGEIADRCQTDKFKASRKKVRKSCICLKIAKLKGASEADPECLAKVDAKFFADVARAEQKAADKGVACPSGGEAEILCDAVDQDPRLCCLNLFEGQACR